MDNLSQSIDAKDFWQFSSTLYAKTKKVCLYSQNELGANVNMLLLMCYLGEKGLVLTSEQLVTLKQSIELSDIHLKRHRTKRIAAKDGDSYHNLLTQELALEKKQQQLLIAQINQFAFTESVEAKIANIKMYIPTLGQHQINDLFGNF